VIFDRAVDETTLAGGNFFVTGPDFDTMLGPDLQLWHDIESVGTEDEILQSPGFEGIVQGKITFERTHLTQPVTVSSQDTLGSGILYRTKAIFTPEKDLSPDTTYTVYLSGDEDASDSLQTGISPTTVFDTVASGTNQYRTGVATFEGGYLGTITDRYFVRITQGGEVGLARFEYWRDSAPSIVHGPFKTKRGGVLLEDGVEVSFTDGTYGVGDVWHVVVKARDVFSGSYKWPFKTGSGAIQDIPSTTSTTVIGDIGTTTTATSTSTTASGQTFKVVKTIPADETTNLSPTPNGS
jgi:hypothetical protein